MIQWLKDNLLPFEVIAQDEAGLRFKRGKYTETLDPGMYWFWPLADEIRSLNTQSQLIDLPDKSITDKSGTTWAVSGCIEYYVETPKKAMVDVQDYDEAVQNKACALVAEAVYQGKNKTEVEEWVMEGLPEHAEKWGLEVTDFTINELARCKVLRIMGIG
jgi:regulator of protease activity HflC (stomatin/prohibitin superfamily)